MKHARSDYNRFQDPEGKIPEDEPVFLIRGQDPAGPATLEAYANLAKLSGADMVIVAKSQLHAEAMRRWQDDHPEAVHPADL